MILSSEDFQFHQRVPFVRIEEYSYRRREAVPATQSLVHFNDQGQLLSCYSPMTKERVQCFYRDGLLVKRLFEAQESSIKREENRIYTESGLLVEKNLVQGNRLSYRAHYKYNENLELVREENLQNNKIYLYNERGLCIEEQIKSDSEHIRSLFYAYDENGNIIELVEEGPVGQTYRIHKYSFNNRKLIEQYQLINQDGLVLSNLRYQYCNFIDNDWLERYTWRLSGRGGKFSQSHTLSCYRSPCLQKEERSAADFRSGFQTLELREGRYSGQVRVGLMHGIGRLDFFDGSHYLGSFRSGRMEGYGSFYWPDGRLYQGYFSQNKMEGKGSYYLANGSLHHGTFSGGKMLAERPCYFLEGSSPLSKENRKVVQRKNGKNAKNAKNGGNANSAREKKQTPEDRAFIQAAAQALGALGENAPAANENKHLAISEEEVMVIQREIFAGEEGPDRNAEEWHDERHDEGHNEGQAAESPDFLWNENELLSTLFLTQQEDEPSSPELQRIHIQEQVPKK